MHPEVKSDKPGKCPKCGMELVEKKQDTYSKYFGNLDVEGHKAKNLREAVNME